MLLDNYFRKKAFLKKIVDESCRIDRRTNKKIKSILKSI